MGKYLTMDDFDFKDKTVLVRVDFNSPIDPDTKRVLDDTRIRAHGEATIRELLEKGAKVVVLAHQGRPGEPDFTPLKEHTEILRRILGKPTRYVEDVFGEKAQRAIKELKAGEALVLENVRFYSDERKKGTAEEHAKTEFVRNLAPLADVFVNDAFAAAHRSHVSIIGFTPVLPSLAGRIMERELKALGRVLHAPQKPCVYILGGAKADDALQISQYVLENTIADHVLTGGVVGHLFLAAKGIDLGKPNMEFLRKKELTKFIPGIKKLMSQYPGKIEVPIDLAVEANGKRLEMSVDQLPTDHPIYDIGEKTIMKYRDVIQRAKSIVISGPLGVFENKEFAAGTRKTLEAIASSQAFSLVGGGHTIAAVEELGLAGKMGYVSTAGGALIEFLMGGQLPGVLALESAADRAIASLQR